MIKEVLQTGIFALLEAVVLKWELFTKFYVAWLNLPPPPIWLGLMQTDYVVMQESHYGATDYGIIKKFHDFMTWIFDQPLFMYKQNYHKFIIDRLYKIYWDNFCLN